MDSFLSSGQIEYTADILLGIQYQIMSSKDTTKDLRADEDYIFINSNDRRHSRGLDNTLRDLCDKAGIPQKSFHDIRRTVASEMHDNGCSLEEIRKWLGHKDIATTQKYIYSLKRRSEYANIVNTALKGNEANIFRAS